VRKLAGWTLRDEQGHVYTFPRTRVGPGHSFTVHTGKETDYRHQRVLGEDWYVWNNSGDTATLQNRTRAVVDSCSWGNGDGTTTC
jgi:hypothetical protein